MNSGDIVATAPHQTIQIDPIETAPFRLSPTEIRGIKGALRIPLLSFQYFRRPGGAAQLLCFHTAGGFESHRLHHSPWVQPGDMGDRMYRLHK